MERTEIVCLHPVVTVVGAPTPFRGAGGNVWIAGMPCAGRPSRPRICDRLLNELVAGVERPVMLLIRRDHVRQLNPRTPDRERRGCRSRVGENVAGIGLPRTRRFTRNHVRIRLFPFPRTPYPLRPRLLSFVARRDNPFSLIARGK